MMFSMTFLLYFQELMTLKEKKINGNDVKKKE